MAKEYIQKTTNRAARPRSRRLRELGGTTSGTAVSVIQNGGATSVVSGDGHTHKNLPYLDQITTDNDGYVNLTHPKENEEDGSVSTITEKAKAGYADKAGHADDSAHADAAALADEAKALSADSPTREEFLSAKKADEAEGLITFRNGWQTKKYVPGLAGTGSHMWADGTAEMDSLTIRKWLEVPELRYNRVDVSVGNRWRCPGGGIIETVTAEADGTGTVTLHLEQGEIGCVAVGDICMGIFHDYASGAANEGETSDDGIGGFKFAGFTTVYFKVTEITESVTNSAFRYVLRPSSENWSAQAHPFPGMHFCAYGNDRDAARQSSRYSTLKYERYLKSVSDWVIGKDNVAAQFGDLSNLSIFGLNMTGYSAYLNNIYMSGVIQQIEDSIDIRFAFSAVDTSPGNPEDSPDNWHERAAGDDVWMAMRKKLNGAWGSWGIVQIKGKKGDPGKGGPYTAFAYKLAGTMPETPVGILPLPEGWSESIPDTEKYAKYADVAPVLSSGSWTQSNKRFASNAIGDSKSTWAKIKFDTATDDAMVAVRITASSEENYDWGYICNLDSPFSTSSYLKRVSGKQSEVAEISVPTAGEHYLYVGYAKDGSSSRGDDNVIVEFMGGDSLWMTSSLITDGVAGTWSTPIKINGKDGKDGINGRDGKDGINGKDGKSGLSYRYSKWTAGIEYRNDNNPYYRDSNGQGIIDVVYSDSIGIYDPSSGATPPAGYVCRQTHTSSASHPLTAGNDWAQINSMSPVLTTLVLASRIKAEYIDVESIFANLVTAGTVQLGSNSGAVKAGITGSGHAGEDIRIWAGASFENRATAPFRVQQDGKVIMDNAEVTGKVVASSGSIGGFEIGSGRIGRNGTGDSYDGLSIYDTVIFVRDKSSATKVYASVGNYMPGSTGIKGAGRFEMVNDNTYGDGGTALLAKYMLSYAAQNNGSELIQRPLAFNRLGNELAIGKTANYETGYIGKAATNILEDYFKLTHTFVFDTIGTSNLSMYLPSKTLVDAELSNRITTFSIRIVVAGMSNKITLMPPRQSQSNTTAVGSIFEAGSTKSKIELDWRDAIELQYYSGNWYVISQNWNH